MSKDRTYIIVLGGVFSMIVILIIGLLSYFFYQPEQIEIGKQIVNMLKFVIPSMIGTAMVMGLILTVVEKKEFKAVTKLNIEYQEKIIESEKDNRKTLHRIELNIAVNKKLQEEYFADRKKKDEIHKTEHKEIKKQFITLEEKVSEHDIFIKNQKIKNAKTG